MKTTLPTFYIFCASMMTLGFSSIAQAELSTCGGTPSVKTASDTVTVREHVKVDLTRLQKTTWDDPLAEAKDTENLLRLCNKRNKEELEGLDDAVDQIAEKYNTARDACYPYTEQGGATHVSFTGIRLCGIADRLYAEYEHQRLEREVKAAQLKNECEWRKSTAAQACDALQERIRTEFGSGYRAEKACSDRSGRLQNPTYKFSAKFGPLCAIRSVDLRRPGLKPVGDADVFGEQDLSGEPGGCTVPNEMIITCEGIYDAVAVCEEELLQCPPAIQLDGSDIPDYILGRSATLFE